MLDYSRYSINPSVSPDLSSGFLLADPAELLNWSLSPASSTASQSPVLPEPGALPASKLAALAATWQARTVKYKKLGDQRVRRRVRTRCMSV